MCGERFAVEGVGRDAVCEAGRRWGSWKRKGWRRRVWEGVERGREREKEGREGGSMGSGG